jgi:hypothetical protein
MWHYDTKKFKIARKNAKNYKKIADKEKN